MEVIQLSTKIPASKFLMSPQIIQSETLDHFHVRILDVNGNILVKPFITNEKPVAISKDFLLTAIQKEGRNKYSRSYVVMRSLSNLRGKILQIIEPPPLPQNDDGSLGHVDLSKTISGSNNSFMFTYYVSYPYGPEQNLSGLRVNKYDRKRYRNMEKFLDEKLGD